MKGDGPVDGPPSRVLVVAWTRVSGRQRELAELVGGTTAVIHPPARSIAWRYLISATRTWRVVRTLRRGDVCIVTAPPVFTPAVTMLAARRGVVTVMDSHPGAFGLMGDRLSRLLRPLHAWCVRRAAGVLVTTDGLVQTVTRLGGRGMVFHEPDRRGSVTPVAADVARGPVVFPGVFARDEPIDVVMAVADRLPGTRFVLTGDAEKHGFATTRANVSLTGWLDAAAFDATIADAGFALVLSTDPESVMRTAYEATRARRPLIVTDTPATRAYFPYAWHVPNDAAVIAATIEDIRAMPAAARDERIDAAGDAERAATRAQTMELTRLIGDASVAARGRPRRRRRR